MEREKAIMNIGYSVIFITFYLFACFHVQTAEAKVNIL